MEGGFLSKQWMKVKKQTTTGEVEMVDTYQNPTLYDMQEKYKADLCNLGFSAFDVDFLIKNGV